MDPRLVTPYLIVAIVIWGLYRRLRRSFGRQRVREGFMWFRVGILTVLAVYLAVVTAHEVTALGALVAGIACGAALAYVGLRHTRFEVTPAGRFYTPHAYIGAVVAALFVGRVLYRFLAVYDGTVPAAAARRGFAAALQGSPLTLAVYGVLAGYYVLYYLGVLQRTRLDPAVAVGK